MTSKRLQTVLDHEAVRVLSILAYDALHDLEYKANGEYRDAVLNARRAVGAVTAMAVDALYKPGKAQLVKAARK